LDELRNRGLRDIERIRGFDKGASLRYSDENSHSEQLIHRTKIS
jgi:hypothetical protein